MGRILLLLFFAVGVYSTCNATTISGRDTSYAGQKLVFLEQIEPFSGTNKIIGEANVGDNGNFSVELDVEETTYVFILIGVYNLYLFVEPEKDYEVILPQFEAKTQADKLNPFFETVNVHLAIKEFTDDELNIQIRMFLDSYIPFYNKHLDKVLQDKEFEQLDKDISKIEKPFAKSKNEFFAQYREYKYGMLRFLAYQHKSKAVSDQYFKGKTVLYKNPAYIELLNMVYERYFIHFARGDEEKKLSNAISVHQNYDALKKALSADEVLMPDELLNLVALKCLHEEFYDDNFSRKAMLAILDSFIETEKNDVQLQMAKIIREKVTKLMVGFEPPVFNLYDADSNLVNLDKFKGKFIYLNFCSCFSYSCLNEFAMLQKLYDKHKQYIEIVSIVIDDDVEVMKEFLARSGYSWTFLHYDNHPEVLFEYDIRMYPTYYLIDNEGKLVMSPASTPNELFEARLFKVLRARGIL